MLRLYLLRHGQSAYSKTGGYCGTPENDPGLTPKGIEMVKAFAIAYSHIPWTAFLPAPSIALRTWGLIHEVQQAYPTGDILIVLHKAAIRILLCVLLGIDVGRYRDRFNMPVCALSIVELGDRGSFFRMIGDRCHLPDDWRLLPSA